MLVEVMEIVGEEVVIVGMVLDLYFSFQHFESALVGIDLMFFNGI